VSTLSKQMNVAVAAMSADEKNVAQVSALQQVYTFNLDDDGYQVIKSLLWVTEWPAHALYFLGKELQHKDSALSYYALSMACNSLKAEAAQSSKVYGSEHLDNYIALRAELNGLLEAVGQRVIKDLGVLELLDSQKGQLTIPEPLG